jgi:hypothetical protein
MFYVISRLWAGTFSEGVPRFARQYLEETREFRNLLAHGGRVSTRDALRAVDTVERLLSLEAPEAGACTRLRSQLQAPAMKDGPVSRV